MVRVAPVRPGEAAEETSRHSLARVVRARLAMQSAAATLISARAPSEPIAPREKTRLAYPYCTHYNFVINWTKLIDVDWFEVEGRSW